jgi:hypothetical protein
MNKTLIAIAIALALAGCTKEHIAAGYNDPSDPCFHQQRCQAANSRMDGQSPKQYADMINAKAASDEAAYDAYDKAHPELLAREKAYMAAKNAKAGYSPSHSPEEVWQQAVKAHHGDYVAAQAAIDASKAAQTSPYRCASNGSTDGTVYCPTAYDLAHPSTTSPEEAAELRAKANRMLAEADYSRNCSVYGTSTICVDKDNQTVESCVVVPGRGTVCQTKEMTRSHSVLSTTISPVYLRKTSGN